MAEVFLSLGSNLGDRLGYIKFAVFELIKTEKIKLLKVSSIYNTEPWGNSAQGEFLNCVLKIFTDLSPINLFEKIKFIEQKVGRKNSKKWLSREIDIDILFYDNLILKTENLAIPHPEIPNRKFVLVPLNEIAENFIHPILKKSASHLLKDTNDELKCEYFANYEVIIPTKIIK